MDNYEWVKDASPQAIKNLQDPNWWVRRSTTDLYFLARCVMQTLEDPTPGYKDLYRPTHKRICDFVQNYAREGHKVLILTPRGWIKSYLVTVAWTVQRILRNLVNNRREHFMIDNATIGNAKTFLGKIKYNFEFNELIRGIFADQIPMDPENQARRWTQDEIEINGNLIETGSVEGNLVSRHYKIMIHDDLVNRDNSNTAEQLYKTIDWWRLAQSLLLSDGIEIIIGTRWSFDDLYGMIIEKYLKPPKAYWEGHPIVEVHRGNYHLLQMDCWEDPENETGSTFPTLFPEWRLKQLQDEQGDRFPGQYRNNPLAKGKNPFSTHWFRRWKADYLPPVHFTRILIDPSGDADVDSDHTGITVLHMGSDKKVYVAFGRRYLITDRALAEWVIYESPKYNADTIEVESNKYKVIYEMIEMLLPQLIAQGKVPEEHVEYCKTITYRMRELRPQNRNKDLRVRNTVGFVENGTVLFPYSGAEQLEEEMIRYPASKRRDIVDSFAYFLDGMFFPKPTDPPKIMELSPELKMTDTEREEAEWDNIREYHHQEQWAGFEDGPDVW